MNTNQDSKQPPKKANVKKLAVKRLGSKAPAPAAKKAAAARNAAAKKAAVAKGGPQAEKVKETAVQPIAPIRIVSGGTRGDPMDNKNFHHPPCDPKPDYRLDPTNRTKRPVGHGGPIVFPRKGKRDLFQKFLLALVHQYQLINTALATYKHGCLEGQDPVQAGLSYAAAIDLYKKFFIVRWSDQLANKSTWIDPVFSPEGYITQVRVISRAFSATKPTQSSSDTIVYPYPSSSSYSPCT